MLSLSAYSETLASSTHRKAMVLSDSLRPFTGFGFVWKCASAHIGFLPRYFHYNQGENDGFPLTQVIIVLENVAIKKKNSPTASEQYEIRNMSNRIYAPLVWVLQWTIIDWTLYILTFCPSVNSKSPPSHLTQVPLSLKLSNLVRKMCKKFVRFHNRPCPSSVYTKTMHKAAI